MTSLVRLALTAAVCCAALAEPAFAAQPPTAPVYDAKGNLVATPFTPPVAKPRLTRERATAAFLASSKVADWLARYPPRPATDATFDARTRSWTVRVWSGKAGEVAVGKIDDASGAVLEAWTGPQVAWRMARGDDGAFGGKTINSLPVWLGLCVLFLVGLADVRRPLSLRNLDLLALLSFSVSLWFFNAGDVFVAMPLAYPPMAYLLARLAWVGFRGRAGPRARTLLPAWVLVAATVFLVGFRVGLNVEAPHSVIDVGYSGVIGAHRIANGQAPYGHFPVAERREPCGPPDSEGDIRLRVQTNGRCEHANERGDTYGPVSYVAYLPGFWLFGWSGKWAGDPLWAAHFTAILFDLVCLAALAFVGLRFGGARFAALLAFAWAAYPFTQYASNSNTNDALMPAFLLFGFWLAAVPWARGAFAALSGWTKFGSLIVAPLWLTYPDRRPRTAFAAGFAAATVVAFAVLLLEPNPLAALRTFWERTVSWQVGRESPFSIWGWGQYHAAGIPDLHHVQLVLQLALVAAALALAVWPRRKSPLQLAALTGALLVGFELVLTHWFYLYIPWFFPFAAIALLAERPGRPERPDGEVRRVGDRELVTAG